MIWIPLASILVFVVMLIPSIVLGAKRGWKSALFVCLTFLALNAVVLGVGFAIYHHGLWSVYKSSFMKHEIRDDLKINYDLLSNSYRPRVLLIFAGIISPFTYLATLGIYMLLRKPLNHYLMPQVREVSSSEKELIFRRNAFPSKVIGAGIATVMGVFATSFFASAVNVLVTPRENENGFNKINDNMARIYAFGMAGNTEEVKAISQFLRNVDGEFVKDVQSLMAFGNGVGHDNSEPDSRNNAPKVGRQIDKYKFLFENEDATKAIFSSIVDRAELGTLNLFLYDQVTAAGKTSENYGFAHGYETSIVKDINSFENWVKANNIAAAHMPAAARQALVEKLIASIDSFDNSIFAQQYAKAQANEKAYVDDVNRPKQLETTYNELAQAIKDQNDQVALIKTNTGYSATEANQTANKRGTSNSLKQFTFTEVQVNRSQAQASATNTQANSRVAQELEKENTLHQTYSNYLADYLTKWNAYETNHKNNYEPAEKAYNTAQANTRAEEAKLASARADRDAANASIASETKNIADADTKMNQLNNRLAQIVTELSTTKTQSSNADTEAKRLDGLISTQKGIVSTHSGEVSKIDSDIKTKQDSITAKEQAAREELAQVDKDVAAIQIRLDEQTRLKSEAANKHQDTTSFDAEITNLQNQIATTLGRKTTITNNRDAEIKTLNDAITTLKSERQSHQSKVDAANVQLATLNPQYTNQVNLRNQADAKISSLTQEQSDKKELLRQTSDAKNNATVNLGQANAKLTKAQADILAYTKTLSDAQTAEATALTEFNRQKAINTPLDDAQQKAYKLANDARQSWCGRSADQYTLGGSNSTSTDEATNHDANRGQMGIVDKLIGATNDALRVLDILHTADGSKNTDKYKSIVLSNTNIAKLENVDHSFDNHKTTNTQGFVEWTHHDDGSIYYANQYKQYLADATSAAKQIALEKAQLYNTLRTRLISVFKTYTQTN